MQYFSAVCTFEMSLVIPPCGTQSQEGPSGSDVTPPSGNFRPHQTYLNNLSPSRFFDSLQTKIPDMLRIEPAGNIGHNTNLQLDHKYLTNKFQGRCGHNFCEEYKVLLSSIENLYILLGLSSTENLLVYLQHIFPFAD